MITAQLPPLPPGYDAEPAHATTGILATLTSRGGAPVTLHHAEYTHLSPAGDHTRLGYAWRCTHCPQVYTGYPADTPTNGYARAKDDAAAHNCQDGARR